ncbi:ATP-binding cassette domain-containing protein [Microvirga rosea]|uniref:ATP-binding cassette domain-containing protein n=1 Tax=Microvirga rosea TaxID=2715425 RepID=UPI001D09C1EC|nr:ABC transporter ATP-binding protein [Microvirga rosea]MCB8820575.1 ABC transporter ATP-binding protein [Microvirga rosea]
MAPILSVEGLSVGFLTDLGFRETVHEVSFSVERGKTLCIVGESGSGKSVVCQAILGILARNGRRTGGRVLFEGRDLCTFSEREMETIRGKGIGMVFQDPLGSLNPIHTVGRQLRETLILHTDLDERGRQRRAVELLRMVGIPEPERRLASYAHQFSGGMAQRVLIAMALACNPKLLIADEPTTALDVTIQAQILDLLNRLKTEIGMGILFITHDLGVVAEMADDVVVMRHGRQVEVGSIQDIFVRPQMAYTQELLASMPHLNRKAPIYRENA